MKMKRFFKNFTKKIPMFNNKVNQLESNVEKDGNIIVDLEIEDIMPGRYGISPLGKIIDKKSNTIIEISYRNRIGRVALYSNKGKIKEYSLNRLVAITFLPKTEKDIQYNRNLVHVRDWNNMNHTVENLQWSNPAEVFIYTNFYKYDRKDRDDEKIYIKMLIRRNYDFDDILDVIPFKTPMHDIVAIYGDMKI